MAIELYRVMQEIEGLDKELESLNAGSQERHRIEDTLRKARVEKVRLKKMIEGAKGD